MPELLMMWAIVAVLSVMTAMGWALFGPAGIFLVATVIVVCLLLLRRRFNRRPPR